MYCKPIEDQPQDLNPLRLLPKDNCLPEDIFFCDGTVSTEVVDNFNIAAEDHTANVLWDVVVLDFYVQLGVAPS